MPGPLFCAFAVMMLASAQGGEKEQSELLRESVRFGSEDEPLQCFRCDLGFLDACYTTETNCSRGERCYTGRGKAAELDVKTLGCVKAEECEVATTVELFNQNIYVLTKHCCNTPFCNTAHRCPVDLVLCFTVAFLITWLPH